MINNLFAKISLLVIMLLLSTNILADDASPATTSLISPKGGITKTTPTYQWNAVADASWYYLWVNDSQGNKINKWYTAAQAGCTESDLCSVSPTTVLNQGAAKWWVRTWNTSGYGKWSSALEFTIGSGGGAPIATSLVSPTGTIKETAPSYQWSAVSNASWYYLWVNDSQGNKINKWYTAAQAGCSTGSGLCSVTSATVLKQGTGKWWVRTWNTSGYGKWSSALQFTIASGSAPVATSLVSPKGSITETTPAYQWNAVATASWYYLWVNDSKGNKIKKWYTAEQAGCSTGSGLCSVKPTTVLAQGVGKWWVRTWNTSGYGEWSEGLTYQLASVPAKIENIAHKFGKVTQGRIYGEYKASYAIDNDLETMNHTQCNSTDNWLQVELPNPSQIVKIVIHNRLGANSGRLNAANIYLGLTPYIGAVIDENLIETLDASAVQTFEYVTSKKSRYLLIKANGTNCLHLREVEIYGTVPEAPVIKNSENEYLISGTTPKGSLVKKIEAIDYQNDTLVYSLIGDVPFEIDSKGNITVDDTLARASYIFEIEVSDGVNKNVKSITIKVTSSSVINDVLISGDVINTSVTEMELIQAVLDETEVSKRYMLDAKAKIFNLEADGTAKTDGSSLTGITWNPTHDASLFSSSLGKNTTLLYTNAVEKTGYTVYKKEIGIIGKEDNGKYLVFGANPLRVTGNEQMDQLLENSFSWLTNRDNLKTSPFKVVLAHLDNSYWFRDETKTREWLEGHYAGQVSYNAENVCDGSALQACLDDSADLLIISQVSADSDDTNAIASTVKNALKKGIPVLYVHHDGNHKPLGKSLFSSVFNVHYDWDNYWKKLSLNVYNPTADLNVLSEGLTKVKVLFTHLKDTDYNFDWSKCSDGKGNYDSKYDKCSEVTGLYSEFEEGANVVRGITNNLDAQKKNIFLEEGYKLQKLLVLTADKFRQSVNYPMDKVTTDDNEFMKSYYADHAIYNYRKINPTQINMGNFSRSDFSHITPITKTVNLKSKRRFRSTGVYALPGQTVRATRNDSSELTVKVFINTLRSGATHQYQQNGYKRPKYLQTTHFEIKSGESIQLTSPYGGILELEFSKNDLPVAVTFENVGEHPYWASSADNDSFVQKMLAKEYDWTEVATAGFEVHSKLDKMEKSIANDSWGRTAAGLAQAIEKYTSNYPHVLAGFKGEGVDVVNEIHDWATSKGITIETIDIMKHMNADQATCGYGCSGNPYDAYWAFNPIGHGDIHELGHSLQKKRFEGFPNHAATNTFSYYTKSRYFDITGGDNSCGGQPFKSLFQIIQSSVGKSDIESYLKTNLWDKAGLGEQYLLKIQAMMHAEKKGKLENGWHVLARVHILEREMKRAKQDWENRKVSVGFDHYTLDEINTIRDNDWLVIAYSYGAELDFRDYFDMMGIPYSEKARGQIGSFGFASAPKALFVSTDKGYCNTDTYGRLFDRPTLPIDGVSVYPY